ncbi:MAG: hypothetical protein SCH12_05480 [Nitrosomonadaceae bacterium]|nr:hypothetical protein [Nitrosomonadaceae bacterium]
MFNFLRNKSFGIATADLDGCIAHIISLPNRAQLVGQIIGSIIHWSSKMDSEGVTAKQIQAHYQDHKNKIMLDRGLKNLRDSDFCIGYILMCFFFFLVNYENGASREGASKILSLCEKFSESSNKDIAFSVTKPFKVIFKI